MDYIRTKLATDWAKNDAKVVSAAKMLLAFIPKANPGYDKKMHLIREWYVEFDNDGNPWREIGLDEHGAPVVAGPTERDYGFWLDTHMKRGDFEGDVISREMFEQKWQATGVSAPE